MLYLFYGDDRARAREKVQDLTKKLLAKKPDASVFAFNPESWNPGQFEELLGAQTLFAGKSIVVGEDLFSEDDSSDFVVKHLLHLKESENIFLLLEGELTKDIVTRVEKKAEKVQEFALSKSAKGESKKEFPIFSLSDALGRRDRRGLWVLYHRALHAGLAPEELFWKFVWQVKNMILASQGSKTPTPESLKMNPFVFKKAVSAAQNFTTTELHGLHRRLLELYHEARRGRVDFGTSLERVILDL